MIKKFDVQQLTATQYLQFLVRLAQLILGADPAKLKIKLRFDALNDIVDRLEKVVKKDQELKETEEIVKLDNERDDAIIGFLEFVKALTRSKKANIKAAALLLKRYLNNLSKHIYSEDFSSETTLLTKLYTDYQTNTEIKNAVVTISAEDWLIEINDANVAFEAKYKDRTVSIGNNEKTESFTKLRKPAKTAYQALVKIIESRYEAAVDDKLDTKDLVKLIDNINALVDQTEQIIASTKPKGGDSNPPKDPPPPVKPL